MWYGIIMYNYINVKLWYSYGIAIGCSDEIVDIVKLYVCNFLIGVPSGKGHVLFGNIIPSGMSAKVSDMEWPEIWRGAGLGWNMSRYELIMVMNSYYIMAITGYEWLLMGITMGSLQF